MKQTNLEDPFDNSGDDDISGDVDTSHGSDDDLPPTPPRPSTPQPAKGLPWTPKVRLVVLHTGAYLGIGGGLHLPPSADPNRL